MAPSGDNVEFSSHEILIPVPRRRYAYKVVYQTGFCMDTKEKRYLGVDTISTKLEWVKSIVMN